MFILTLSTKGKTGREPHKVRKSSCQSVCSKAESTAIVAFEKGFPNLLHKTFTDCDFTVFPDHVSPGLLLASNLSLCYRLPCLLYPPTLPTPWIRNKLFPSQQLFLDISRFTSSPILFYCTPLKSSKLPNFSCRLCCPDYSCYFLLDPLQLIPQHSYGAQNHALYIF